MRLHGSQSSANVQLVTDMQGLVVVSLFRPSRNRSTCLWVGVGIGVVLIVAMVLVVARIGSSTGDGQSDNKNSDDDRCV